MYAQPRKSKVSRIIIVLSPIGIRRIYLKNIVAVAELTLSRRSVLVFCLTFQVDDW